MSTTNMFDQIAEVSHRYLQAQIDDLRATCEKDPAVSRMVGYILAHGAEIDSKAYPSSFESQVGREIIQFIWEITRIDLSSISNSYHFDPSWASRLGYFIGNYIYDDSAFYFTRHSNGVFEFKPSTDNDPFYQNADLLVEAAIANRKYYDRTNYVTIHERASVKVDDTEFMKVLNNRTV